MIDSRDISRLLALLLVAFALVTGAAAYWAIAGPETILTREDNPRRVEYERSIRRGSIYDRDNQRLAQSSYPEGSDIPMRNYHYPAMHSALGYASLRYGVGGTEATYDSLLRGDVLMDDFMALFARDVLHRPQKGWDIQLTLDLDVQRRLIEAMNGRQGAAVVLAVPSGEILAQASLPTFNPNHLDDEWEQLVDAPGNPFFNRVVQGQYQPGSILQTPLMAAARLAQINPGLIIADGNKRVLLDDDIALTCAVSPPQADISLQMAYAYACPYPFTLLPDYVRAGAISDIMANFVNLQTAAVRAFAAPVNDVTTRQAPSDVTLNLEDIVGQGNITINPLGMAMVTAAIATNGNAPQPVALRASRPPGEEEWQLQTHRPPTIPFLTADTARQMRQMMQTNTEDGSAALAYREDAITGGHAATALSGDAVQSWFIGFIGAQGGRGAVIALVLEDEPDAAVAAAIGAAVLDTAYPVAQEIQPRVSDS